jgi:aryl-alcohol dehydrogenase
MRIQAAVLSGRNGTWDIGPVDLDECRPDEAIVEIVSSGICHSDLAVRSGDIPLPELPAVLGHEGAGRVLSVGSAVTKVQPGDHVILSFAYCGRCAPCNAEAPARCTEFMRLNVGGRRDDGSHTHSRDGRPLSSFFGQSSFATHSIVRECNMVKAPDDLPLEILSAFGCGIQTGAGTVLNSIQPEPGSSIAIFGAGAVGLSAVMAAKIAGCARIVAVDLNPDRLELARDLGATDTFDARQPDILDRIREVGGDGVDHCMDASGAPSAVALAISVTKMRGSVSLVGVPPANAMLNVPLGQLLAIKVQGVTEGESNPDVFIPQLIKYHREDQGV